MDELKKILIGSQLVEIDDLHNELIIKKDGKEHTLKLVRDEGD